MAQPQPRLDVVVKNSGIRKYFSTEEWKELSDYEKEQIRNVMRNYLVMTSIGFKVPLPFFMTDFEARRNQASVEQRSSSSALAKIKSCPPKNEKMKAPTGVRGHLPKNKEATTRARGRPLKNEARMTHKQDPHRASKTASEPLSKYNSITAKPPPTLSKGIASTRQQPPRCSKTAGIIFMKNSILASQRKYTRKCK